MISERKDGSSMTSLLAGMALSLLHGQIHSCPSPGQLLALLQMSWSWASFSFPSHFPILIPAGIRCNFWSGEGAFPSTAATKTRGEIRRPRNNVEHPPSCNGQEMKNTISN